MQRFFVDDIQAVDPGRLPAEAGIVVTVAEEADSMGLPRVEVDGPSSELVVEYVRRNWGDDDKEWFQRHVVDRVISYDEEPTMTVVLVDAAGDDAADGDFVHVDWVTVRDLREPTRWMALRERMLEAANAVEARDRGA